MDKGQISPGLLDSAQVKALRQFIQSTIEVSNKLDLLTRSNEYDIPVKLTAFDPITEAYSWVEQWYEADGTRVDYDGGRSGNSSYMPAYATGNGIGPDSWEFPIETRIRPRINTALGFTYEFPWNCSCGEEESGSGTLPVTVACCPNPLPSTLYITMGGDYSYLGTLPIYWNGTVWSTGGLPEEYIELECGPSIQIVLWCLSGSWYIFIQIDATVTQGPAMTVDSCSPLMLTGSGVVTDGGCTEDMPIVVTQDPP